VGGAASDFGDQDSQEVRVADVQAFYDRCVERGSPPSARSIEMVVATLRRILTDAAANEVVDRNVVDVWKRGRGRRRRSGPRAENVKPV
jgi:hypothetical protein